MEAERRAETVLEVVSLDSDGLPGPSPVTPICVNRI
jgi:hypothetical protein